MTMADTIAVMNGGRIEQLGSPAELYELPVTTFAANFLGQSNLLAATVTGRQGDDLLLDVHGRRLVLPRGRAATASGRLWLGVRPEKLRVTSAGAAGNSLTGIVTDASFTGVATHYLVRLPWDQEITVVQQNDGTPPMRAGEPVTVSWAAAHGFALDASEDAHAGQETVLPAADQLTPAP